MEKFERADNANESHQEVFHLEAVTPPDEHHRNIHTDIPPIMDGEVPKGYYTSRLFVGTYLVIFFLLHGHAS